MLGWQGRCAANLAVRGGPVRSGGAKSEPAQGGGGGGRRARGRGGARTRMDGPRARRTLLAPAAARVSGTLPRTRRAAGSGAGHVCCYLFVGSSDHVRARLCSPMVLPNIRAYVTCPCDAYELVCACMASPAPSRGSSLGLLRVLSRLPGGKMCGPVCVGHDATQPCPHANEWLKISSPGTRERTSCDEVAAKSGPATWAAARE